MERFLWIASHFSAKLLFILLCLGIGILIYIYPNDLALSVIRNHKGLLIPVGIITIICAVFLCVLGGKAGYKYVDMGRSKHWNYRNTAYSRSDDRLRNTLYWAIEFALFPINGFLIVVIVILLNLM